MERVGAALSGGKPDRRPFALTLSLYGSRLLGASASDYYADPGLYAAGQRAVVDLCEPDVVFGPFAFALEAAAFGAAVERPKDAPPIVKKPAVKSARASALLKAPDIESDPYLSFLLDSVRAVVEDQRGTRPVAAPIVAPCDLPILLVGMDAWIDVLLFDPELSALWSKIAVDHFKALSAAYFKAGASFLVTPVMLVNPALMHAELADRVLLPILREAFSSLSGPVVFHHGGTRIASCIDRFKGLPNLAGFVVDEGDSLAMARRNLGPEPLLLGNLSGPHFSRRRPADIRARALKALQDREADPRYILASSAADIPYETDPESVVAVRRAIESSC